MAGILIWLEVPGTGCLAAVEDFPPETFRIQGEDLSRLGVDDLWLRADQYWHNGDYEDSIAACRRIVQIEPTFIEAYINVAWLLWSMGRGREAIAFLEEGVRKNPEVYDLYFELGIQYGQYQRDFEKALPWLRAAVQHPPYPGFVPRQLAYAYQQTGRHSQALEVWQNLRTQQPGPLVELNFHRVLQKASRSDSLALSGGVLIGEANREKQPLFLREEKEDADGDGQVERRQAFYEAPDDRDGEPDYLIVYEDLNFDGQADGWRWMVTDANDNGTFDVVGDIWVEDLDKDGVAESRREYRDFDGDGQADASFLFPNLTGAASASPWPQAASVHDGFSWPSMYEIGEVSEADPLGGQSLQGHYVCSPPVFTFDPQTTVTYTLSLRHINTGQEKEAFRQELPQETAAYNFPHPLGAGVTQRRFHCSIPVQGWAEGEYYTPIQRLWADEALMDEKVLADWVLQRDGESFRLRPHPGWEAVNRQDLTTGEAAENIPGRQVALLNLATGEEATDYTWEGTGPRGLSRLQELLEKRLKLRTSRLSGLITSESLSQVDVLLVIAPSGARLPTPEEAEEVGRWSGSKHTLFFVGGPAEAFNLPALNALSGQFGLTFSTEPVTLGPTGPFRLSPLPKYGAFAGASVFQSGPAQALEVRDPLQTLLVVNGKALLALSLDHAVLASGTPWFTNENLEAGDNKQIATNLFVHLAGYGVMAMRCRASPEEPLPGDLGFREPGKPPPASDARPDE